MSSVKYMTKEDIIYVITEFTAGKNDIKPNKELVNNVERVVWAAYNSVTLHCGDICVDDCGEVNFYFILNNKMLLMSEVSLETDNFYTGVYETGESKALNSYNPSNENYVFMPCEVETMINLFEKPLDVIKEYDLVHKFSKGIDGKIPNEFTINNAQQIIRAALSKNNNAEFIVDNDGALSINIRANNGMRILAELNIDGILDAGFYNDDVTKTVIEVEYLSQITVQDLINYF